jgi:hypothetical protein
MTLVIVPQANTCENRTFLLLRKYAKRYCQRDTLLHWSASYVRPARHIAALKRVVCQASETHCWIEARPMSGQRDTLLHWSASYVRPARHIAALKRVVCQASGAASSGIYKSISKCERQVSDAAKTYSNYLMESTLKFQCKSHSDKTM